MVTPIAIFAYNRLAHLERLLVSLRRNPRGAAVPLYLFCDGLKADATPEARRAVESVQHFARTMDWPGDLHVCVSAQNQGLSQAVRSGVTHVLRLHESVIVLEDDLVVGSGFLSYMQEALSRYATVDQVTQVSGFTFPFSEASSEAYFLPISTTLGWGTWRRVWDNFDQDPNTYQHLISSNAARRRFDLAGTFEYSKMLSKQIEGRGDSWGVLFWAHTFGQDGLVLYPSYSLLQHEDVGRQGVHAADQDYYNTPAWNADVEVWSFPDEIKGDVIRFESFCNYIRTNRPARWRRAITKARTIAGQARV